MLAMLLPNILPIARSVVPCSDDVILTTSSGADVPNATIVSPIIISDIQNLFAMLLDPSTKRSAPLIRNPNHSTSNTIVRIMSYVYNKIIRRLIHENFDYIQKQKMMQVYDDIWIASLRSQ